MFSSAEVDPGTRFLLKVFSQILDEDIQAGNPLPCRVLDAGCGTGVIGVCAASAIRVAGGDVCVRAQDRDELARLFTAFNARKNGIPVAALEAFAEPLLAAGQEIAGGGGGGDSGWDLILTNIPAKTGRAVLDDFVSRSAGLLNRRGRVMMVAVRTLADFFRERIAGCALLEREEADAEHHVFVYRKKNLCDDSPVAPASPVKTGGDFIADYPFYRRDSVDCGIEEIPLRIETVHGAPDFDSPDGTALAAAKLTRRLGAGKLRAALDGEAAILVHEPGQGFFPCFLREFLRRECGFTRLPPMVLSGRNILALEASRINYGEAALVPAADLRLGGDALLMAAGRRFSLAVVFPELLPQSSLPKEACQFAALWDAAAPLMTAGGIFIAGFSSTDAERFDRKKPPAFTRMGDIKRKGFRALAYCKTGAGE